MPNYMHGEEKEEEEGVEGLLFCPHNREKEGSLGDLSPNHIEVMHCR